MITITERDAPSAYREALWKIRTCAVVEDSRNGEVLTLEEPALISILYPQKRLITDPVRDANPFFHCMEFVWMMAGSNDVKWLAQFNSRYMEYSDDGSTVHAAYGARWRWQLGVDQIEEAVQMLIEDPTSRRIVIQMWESSLDLNKKKKDLPCNTQIMLRVVKGKLNMTVINRSNDLIWGAMGANVVHMTMLQEFLAQAANLDLGKYRVFSNNLHMYTGMPRYNEIYNHEPDVGIYREEVQIKPLLSKQDSWKNFLWDAETLLDGGDEFNCSWIRDVAKPIHDIYMRRKEVRREDLGAIKSEDWRIACEAWLLRRYHM